MHHPVCFVKGNTPSNLKKIGVKQGKADKQALEILFPGTWEPSLVLTQLLTGSHKLQR